MQLFPAFTKTNDDDSSTEQPLSKLKSRMTQLVSDSGTAVTVPESPGAVMVADCPPAAGVITTFPSGLHAFTKSAQLPSVLAKPEPRSYLMKKRNSHSPPPP